MLSRRYHLHRAKRSKHQPRPAKIYQCCKRLALEQRRSLLKVSRRIQRLQCLLVKVRRPRKPTTHRQAPCSAGPVSSSPNPTALPLFHLHCLLAPAATSPSRESYLKVTGLKTLHFLRRSQTCKKNRAVQIFVQLPKIAHKKPQVMLHRNLLLLAPKCLLPLTAYSKVMATAFQTSA